MFTLGCGCLVVVLLIAAAFAVTAMVFSRSARPTLDAFLVAMRDGDKPRLQSLAATSLAGHVTPEQFSNPVDQVTSALGNLQRWEQLGHLAQVNLGGTAQVNYQLRMWFERGTGTAVVILKRERGRWGVHGYNISSPQLAVTNAAPPADTATTGTADADPPATATEATAPDSP